MWSYIQSDGDTFRGDGSLACVGYSGHGAGRNNPDLEGVRSVGPIPCGDYMIGNPHDSDVTGPLSLDLTPEFRTRVRILELGREPDSFKGHGDNAGHDASRGCVIWPRAIRVEMAASVDTHLKVFRDAQALQEFRRRHRRRRRAKP
jgi:hypothetical protein